LLGDSDGSTIVIVNVRLPNGDHVRYLAYLDPGSGSVLLQALLGGVAAIAITGKLWWHRLLTLLRIRKPEAEEAEKPAAVPDESGQSRVS
jgi:hypothetical protein